MPDLDALDELGWGLPYLTKVRLRLPCDTVGAGNFGSPTIRIGQLKRRGRRLELAGAMQVVRWAGVQETGEDEASESAMAKPIPKRFQKRGKKEG
jgi:hypothetical protein